MARNGLPVSDDIIDRILMCSPTFSTLLAAILTTKSFYQVFRTHPKSILRAVAYNVTGLALPQALRCIRHPDIAKHSFSLPIEWDNDNEDEDMATEEQMFEGNAMDEEDLLNASITAAETHKLVKNANIVARLEDLFRFRYLDRCPQTNQLSPLESENFRAALYDLMLYSSIYHPSTWHSVSDNDDTQNERKHSEILAKKTKLLSDKSTSELLQIHSVAEFLKEIIFWCIRFDEYPDGIAELALAAGPTLILECFDNQEGIAPLEDILDYLEEELEFHPVGPGYLSIPLVKVLEERKAKPPPSDFTHWRSISPRITEKNTQCDRCHKSLGFAFFHGGTLVKGSKCDWDSNSIRYHENVLHTHLKGNLRFNPVETQDFLKELQKHGSNYLSKIWDDLWDLNVVKQAHQEQQGTAEWTREGCLCPECFRVFMIENLWIWFREQKAAAGPLKENCWYGYNCRTQTHKPEHAGKLNHLCEQSKQRGP